MKLILCIQFYTLNNWFLLYLLILHILEDKVKYRVWRVEEWEILVMELAYC